MYYTYAHYKPDGTMFYIGKGTRHRAHSRRGRNRHWNFIVDKHGDFKVELLAAWPTHDEAYEHEAFLIKCFRDLGFDLSNVADGGKGATGLVGEKNPFFGKKHDDETKKRISETKKNNPSKFWLGKARSEETKKKISESLKGNTPGNKGMKYSKELRQKMSLVQKGKVLSQETKQKLSDSVKLSWIARRQKMKVEV